MNLRELWHRIIHLHSPDRDTDIRIRNRTARTLKAEAALHRAVAEEANARGHKDSAKERRRLAESLEAEASMVRLSDEYDVIRGGREADGE